MVWNIVRISPYESEQVGFSKTNSVSSRRNCFISAFAKYVKQKHWNDSAVYASIGGVHIKNCMYETAETFHGCFSVSVSVVCFKYATTTVLFQFWFSFVSVLVRLLVRHNYAESQGKLTRTYSKCNSTADLKPKLRKYLTTSCWQQRSDFMPV